MRGIRYSIRLKLLMGFGLVAILPLAAMIILYFSKLYTTLLDAAETQLQVGVQQTSLQLVNFFDGNMQNISRQAQFPDFINYIKESEENRELMKPRISAVLTSLARAEYQSYLQSYLLLDENGWVVYDQSQRDLGNNLSAEPFFAEAMRLGYPQIIIDDVGTGARRNIYFSVPIWDSEHHDHPLGVLGLRYNMTVLQSVIGESSLLGGPQSFAILFDPDGNVIAWENYSTPPVKHIDLDFMSGEDFAHQVDLNGVSYTLTYAPLSNDVPLVVAYVKPVSVIYEYIYSDVTPIIIVSVMVMFLVGIGALFVGTQISKPIDELTQTAVELSSGNLDARVKVNSMDELGILGNAVNQMSDRIQKELREIRLGEERYRELSQSLELMVNQRTEELQKANDDLASFSYSVSHDLRAPLRAIDGYSRILEDYSDQLDDEAKGYLHRLRMGAAQMGELIDGLLSLSRLGRQALKRNPISPVELGKLVRDVAQDIHVENPERNVEWHFGDLPGCELDITLMRQVFANLMGNAFKYTRGRDPAVIEVGFSEGVFHISDNGVGFDMQYSDKLFGVFQRLHSSEAFEGTGIGLATVKRIIEKHGGSIWVESKENQGTKFFFTLCSRDDE